MKSLRLPLVFLALLAFILTPASMSQIPPSGIHFIDKTAESNIPGVGAWTAAWLDFNNDGYEDLFTSHYGSPILLVNNGDGTFADVTDTCGIDSGSMAAAVGDFNNDGYLDILTDSQYSTYIYINNKNGTFTGNIPQSGTHPNMWATAVSCVDYDNDGELDFFITRSSSGGNQLFRNNGDGSFTDIISQANIHTLGKNDGSTWADYDNDNYQDLFIISDYGGGTLYHNRGDGTFEVVTYLAPTLCALGSSWGDYNNDGYVDLFISTMCIQPHCNQPNVLYRNNGDGTFTDVTIPSGLYMKSICNNGSWVDYDNDGYLDLFTYGSVDGPGTNILYHNNGDGTFTNVTEQVFGSTLNQTFSAAIFGDYNNDGFVDLYTAPAQLFQNGGNTNNWLALRLEGTQSNKAAIGARIEVYSGELYQIRDVRGGGECHDSEQNSLRVHFGFGSHVVVDKIVIKWPSGIIQELDNIPVNQFLTVVESTKGYAFDGFFSPIENEPVVNNAKAGQVIPVKWRLTDKDGLPISDQASFASLASYVVSCATFEGDPTNSVEESATGSSGLQYLGDGWWQFNWKTPKSYAGLCRIMKLTLDDKSEHTASFSFK